MSLPSDGQRLSGNQISSTNLNLRLKCTYFRFWKQTFAILKFYFRFWSRPFRHSWSFLLDQATEFRPNRSTLRKYDVISISQDGDRYRYILLPVSYLLMSVPSEGQILLANQISSKYLNWRLSYNYFRFRNTNVRHIGILLPVSLSTISP